jgi:hypothetical protein
MDRPHPVHYLTLVIALLAAVFAFLAMQWAAEAREAAESAANQASFGDSSLEISELRSALIRAGVIDDPAITPVDQGTLDGPWARCMTAVDLERTGLDAREVDLPAPCDTATVRFEEDCPDAPPSTNDEGLAFDDDGVAFDASCLLFYRVDGDRYTGWYPAHPADVDRWAETWRWADPASGVDRVAEMAGDGDDLFLHVVDEGWIQLAPWDVG